MFPFCDDTLKIENNPNITSVFMVGDALKGWTDYDKSPLAHPMLRTGDTTFEFMGNLTTGFLKFSCDEIPDWDGRWYLPPDGDTRIDTGAAIKMSFSTGGDGGEDGHKWVISDNALYHITIDKTHGTIKCLRKGDYAPQGTSDVFSHMWLIFCDIERPYAEAMTKSGENWTITRNLSGSRYIKFYGETLERTDWDIPYSLKWFCSLSDGETVLDDGVNTGTRNFKYGADNTFSWFLLAGDYVITLNPGLGKVTFTRN